MKLVVGGNAGAGTISMGGFDYHTGERATGELRDLRAGRCIGACLEFAAQSGKPLMIYVFSDGSLSQQRHGRRFGRRSRQGPVDRRQPADRRVVLPRLQPAGSSARCSTRHGGRPARHQQIGYFSADGDVETSSSPAANNVNLLVQTVMLNYMALHGDTGQFQPVLR